MTIRTRKQAEIFLRKMEILRSIKWAQDVAGLRAISWQDFSPVTEREGLKTNKAWHKTLQQMVADGLIYEAKLETATLGRGKGTLQGYAITEAGRKFHAEKQALARRVLRTVA